MYASGLSAYNSLLCLLGFFPLLQTWESKTYILSHVAEARSY